MLDVLEQRSRGARVTSYDEWKLRSPDQEPKCCDGNGVRAYLGNGEAEYQDCNVCGRPGLEAEAADDEIYDPVVEPDGYCEEEQGGEG